MTVSDRSRARALQAGRVIDGLLYPDEMTDRVAEWLAARDGFVVSNPATIAGYRDEAEEVIALARGQR